jgi:MFS family permease
MQTSEGPRRVPRGRHLERRGGLGPRFRALYAGTAVSLLGNYVAYLTIPILVLQILGGDADETAPFSFTYALETIPTLIFGLAGGVLLDRVRLRGAMIVADLIRAAAFFYLAANVDSIGLPTVFALSFLVGSFSAVYENALFAILPSLVPQEKLATANGRIAATQSVMFAAGPVVAGAMANLAGPAPGLWFNGATFLASTVALIFVGGVARAPGRDEEAGFVEETLNGLRFLVGEPRLRDSTIVAATANLVFGFVEATLVVLASVVLGTTEEVQFGILIVAFGIGSTSGAAMASRVIRFLGLGRTMILGLLTMGGGMGLLVFSRYGVLALVFALVMGVGIGLVNVPIATMRQVYTPSAMLGRVITASRALSWGTLPIGALLGGALAEQVSYTPIVRMTPLVLLAVAAWVFTTPLWKDAFGPTYRGPAVTPAGR